VSVDGNDLISQAGIMVQKTEQFFAEHYPGGVPFTIAMDRGG